jgi:hypothetical protein
MNQFAGMANHFPHRAIGSIAARTPSDLSAFYLHLFQQLSSLEAIQVWPTQQLQMRATVSFRHQHPGATLAYLIQYVDGESKKANVEAGGLKADISPMAIACSLFLAASLTEVGFGGDSKSAIQWSVSGGVSFSIQVVKISIRDFEVGLFLNLVLRHDSKIYRTNPHGSVILDLALWLMTEQRF